MKNVEGAEMRVSVYNEDQASKVQRFNESGKTTPKKTERQIKATSGLLVALLLILLSAVPTIFGSLRLNELISGAEITPNNKRFFESPLPVVVHILFAIVYSILGAFQFAAGFRTRWPGWHRAVGRILIVCGLVSGLSGLWMTLFYSQPGTGDLLKVVRLLFGLAMVVSIYLGFTTIRRRKVLRHRAWMMRAYAIGLGAGTQTFTVAVGVMIFGPQTEFSIALQMAAGWVINLAVAEWAIRKRLTSPARA